MKTTLDLDDEVLKGARECAARDGVTLTAFVENAIRAKLSQSPAKERYRFEPTIVHGVKPPNVVFAKRDALYDEIDNS